MSIAANLKTHTHKHNNFLFLIIVLAIDIHISLFDWLLISSRRPLVILYSLEFIVLKTSEFLYKHFKIKKNFLIIAKFSINVK